MCADPRPFEPGRHDRNQVSEPPDAARNLKSRSPRGVYRHKCALGRCSLRIGQPRLAPAPLHKIFSGRLGFARPHSVRPIAQIATSIDPAARSRLRSANATSRPAALPLQFERMSSSLPPCVTAAEACKARRVPGGGSLGDPSHPLLSPSENSAKCLPVPQSHMHCECSCGTYALMALRATDNVSPTWVVHTRPPLR